MQTAAPASIIGFGMSAASSVVKGIGESKGDNYRAEQLEVQAEAGRVKAAQTGAQLTERLDMQLGNIDAVRAAMHDDPASPTGAAIRDWQEEVGTRQKTIAVDNILNQSLEDESAAAYERSAAKYALFGGIAGAAGSGLRALTATGSSGTPLIANLGF